MTKVARAVLWGLLVLAIIAAAVSLAVVISCEIALRHNSRKSALMYLRTRRDMLHRW